MSAKRFTQHLGLPAMSKEFREKAGVGVAPGIDFGQAGKLSINFRRISLQVRRRRLIHQGGRDTRFLREETAGITVDLVGVDDWSSRWLRLTADPATTPCSMVGS